MKKCFGYITVMLISVLFSCGDKERETKEASIEDSTQVLRPASSEIETEVTLPSPLRLATMFKRAGLGFDVKSLNPVSNLNKYNSGQYFQSLNLGVYSADMAYCILNNEFQKAKDYLKNCKELGSHLGISSAFESRNLGTRFESNLGNEDSLVTIVTEIQMETDMLLESNKQSYISSLIFAGAWIEALNTAGNLFDNEEHISTAILEQMNLSHLIIAVLEKQKDSEKNIPALLEEIKTIEDIFNSIEGINGQNTDELDMSSIHVTKAQLKPLFDKINALRTKIVNG